MKKSGLKILGFGYHSYIDEIGWVKTEFMVGLHLSASKNKGAYLITRCKDICKPACLYGME